MSPAGFVKGLFGLAIDLHRRLLVARSVDLTPSCAAQRTLVFAPHPDDETLGCGATIVRKRDSGTEVFVVIAADGKLSHNSKIITPEQLSEIRRAETLRACGVLGVPEDHVTFLNYGDLQLSSQIPALSRKAKELISKINPGEIYVASNIDSHPDHRALNSAVRTAAAELNFSGTMFEYPIWMQSPAAWFDANASLPTKTCQAFLRPLLSLFKLRPVLVRTNGTAARKRAAMDEYLSQVSNLSGEATWAVLDDRFLRKFTVRDEVFFDITEK